MNATTSIDHLSEVIADEGLFASQNGEFRDPSAPKFIFFDDDKELDDELRAFRNTLLDFEEWNAGREHPNNDTVKVGMFEVLRNIREWDDPDPGLERYRERQESRSYNNWLVNFHKRMLASPSNDRYHRVLKALGTRMSDEDMELAVNPVVELRNVLKKIVKFAPGPIDGTVFVNPDGSHHKTSGSNPTSAKAAYIKRHGLEEAFVSVDRVQYEGERTSHYVVSTRKASDQTPSNYYDPNPAWKDHEGGTYAPRACALFMTPKASGGAKGPGIVPVGSHILTVREFEQALIAGADCYDDANEALAGMIESDYQAEGSGNFEDEDSRETTIQRIYDGRVTVMNTGIGSEARDKSSFTEEEEFLYNAFLMIEAEQEASLMLMANQEPNMIHRFVMSSGDYSNVVGLIKHTKQNAPEFLEFVKQALFGDESINEEKHYESEIYSDAVAAFDSDEDAWSVPTGPNGACKRAACINWK